MKRTLLHGAVAVVAALALIGWPSAPAAHAATGPTCYVKPGALVTPDGNSWATAYPLLQTALADSNCTEIWVAAGVYKPGNDPTDTFELVEGQKVYGGFEGNELNRADRNPAAHVTVLSGDIDDNDTHDANGIVLDWEDINPTGTNSYNVVMVRGSAGYDAVTNATVLDGFVITAGQAATGEAGGGLRCDGITGGQCSPLLENLVFSGNRAPGGGALVNDGWGGIASPALVNVLFTGNGADSNGGAVWNHGRAGISSPTFFFVVFRDNDAGLSGGAVYNDASEDGVANPSFTLVRFNYNTAGAYGGAVCNFGFGAEISPAFTAVSFINNTAGINGGAVANSGTGGAVGGPYLDVTFSGNSAYHGGAIWNYAVPDGAVTPSLTNATFSGNHAGGSGGAIYNAGPGPACAPVLSNVILWEDSAALGPEMTNAACDATLSYSVVQGGCASISGAICGSGNLDVDPRLGPLGFYGGSTQTMPLIAGSSAIDTGTNTGCPSADQRLLSRPVDGNFDGTATCDIGAVEYQGHLFADVPVTGKEWMEPWVDAFYYNGITTGCGVGPLIYCPESNVTRAEMAVFILRAMHGQGYAPPPPTGVFSDVPVAGKEWMQRWIEDFYAHGITTGCGLDPLIYCPENNVTRAEMAVFILRAIHTLPYTPPEAPHLFDDVPVAGKEWMEPWIEDFYVHGITTGCGMEPLIYCPENSVTRAEMAVFIDRAFGLYP